VVKRKISRREFVSRTSKTALGASVLLGSGGALAGEAKPRSKIVEVFHPGVVKNRILAPGKIGAMLRSGMQKLLDSKDPWKQLFKPGDRVGLKINCLGRPLIHTHHELIQAVAAQLQEAGVKANDIIVWDRFDRHMSDCGFKFNKTAKGVRCYASESYEGDDNRIDPKQPYVSKDDNPDRREDEGTNSRMSRIFTQECNKHINMAILKDHALAGVTLCLKNIAFGVCDNNSRFHKREHIGPFISKFCARKDARERFVLHMIDGLEGCYDQGPKPSSSGVIFAQHTLWLGFDPVALDTLGTAVIEAKRKAAGLPTLRKSGRHPRHIEMSAKLGLGTNHIGQMDIHKIRLG
jgi:uncharacterized protein (DUF362 family)